MADKRLSERVKAEDLGSVFLFRGWDPADLGIVVGLAKLSRFEKGETLFMQDDECRRLYVLVSGRVQMYRTTMDGRDVTLHTVAPGALVACAALFLDRTFPASAKVVSSEAELISIDGKAFLDLLDERPDLSRRMVGALSMRLTELANLIESREGSDAQSRLGEWILEQPSRRRPDGAREIRLHETKKSIAASLGMTPETFSRRLRRLSDECIIAVEGDVIVIRDANALMAET